MAHDQDDRPDEQEGQVSELAPEGDEPEPISPGDSVAAQPDGESGTTQEGTQGPDAPQVHGIPEPDNTSSR